MSQDPIRNLKYAGQTFEGIRKSHVCDFTLVGQDLMDLDRMDLLRNGGVLAVEAKHINDTEASRGEGLTIMSISRGMTVTGRKSFWAKVVHNGVMDDSASVEAVGIVNKLIPFKGTLKELKDMLNSELPNIVPNYEKYRPVHGNFTFQAKDGGIIFGLTSLDGRDLTYEEQRIFREVVDGLTESGWQSYLLLCQYYGLTEDHMIDLNKCTTKDIYTGGDGWEHDPENKSPVNFIEDRASKTENCWRGFYFHTELLN